MADVKRCVCGLFDCNDCNPGNGKPRRMQAFRRREVTPQVAEIVSPLDVYRRQFGQCSCSDPGDCCHAKWESPVD